MVKPIFGVLAALAVLVLAALSWLIVPASRPHNLGVIRRSLGLDDRQHPAARFVAFLARAREHTRWFGLTRSFLGT